MCVCVCVCIIYVGRRYRASAFVYKHVYAHCACMHQAPKSGGCSAGRGRARQGAERRGSAEYARLSADLSADRRADPHKKKRVFPLSLV